MVPLDVDLRPASIMDENALANLLDAMDETDGTEQVNAARGVLMLDAANIDALVVLGARATTTVEAIALLREAIRIGSRQFLPNGDPSSVDWWWDIETRPFMRAILAYGNLLADAGHRDEASDCFRTLIEMQPNDSVGARVALAEINSTLPMRR